jgi:hypothetical protein
MESQTNGEHTSPPQATSISEHGFWLTVDYKAHFVDFDKFPWFRNATAAQISSVELLEDNHIYWPELDIELSLESISRPDEFPRAGEE